VTGAAVKFYLSALAVLFAAASCSSGPGARLIPDQPGPLEREYSGVARYEEKEIPGYMHYHRAWVAYHDYKNLLIEQEERGTGIGGRGASYIPDEYYKRKQLEYLDAAEAHLAKMFEINKQYPEAYLLQGAIHMARERYKEAVVSLEEVLRLEPLADKAWVYLAYCRWRLGNVGEAKKAVEEALKLRPNSTEAAWLREAIENEERKKALKKEQEGVPPFRPQLERK
jgi:tetratricopeptide (TPR) repeat protein